MFYLSSKRKTKRVQHQRYRKFDEVCVEECGGRLYQMRQKDPRESRERRCQYQVPEGCHLLLSAGLFQCCGEGGRQTEKDIRDGVGSSRQEAAKGQFFRLF